VVDKPNTGEKAGGRKQPDKPAQTPRREFWRWFILYMERKMHQRRTRRKKKKAEEINEQKAARLTAEATRWIAIFTVVLAIVAGLTLWQLIQGGADTKALVTASQQQANGASDQADAAQQFSGAADEISQGIGQAVGKLEAQARASQQSAAAAKDALTNGNRPWINVDGPLTIRKVQWSTRYLARDSVATNYQSSPSITLKNFGTAPAFYVRTGMDQVPALNLGDVPKYEKDISAAQDRSCKEADFPISHPKNGGAVIMPSSPLAIYYDALMEGHIGAPPGEDFKAPLVIVGCISYEDRFSVAHHTKFCFTSDGPASGIREGDKLRQCWNNEYAD